MKFHYSSGQRPLEGFTIKRGVGKGGFGEVYFALSDGGKEVAIKLVRGQSDIELRGIRQCLNLKHPNLVSLYDVREDAHGEPWVIMEYISGETLSQVLNRHPRGLPQELVKQWFPALARAVAYLHDHGIVHRDLKPANIFIEHGLIKVGDYGLSKSISSSRNDAHTQSVGTVHYMAPEIAGGNYNKTVDIYALGVILFEMLTGHPPFDGESAQEVMMKHLMAVPDLSKLSPAYKAIVGKAMSKDPNHRQQAAAELAAEVEAAGAPPIPVAKPVAVPVAKAVPVGRVANPDRPDVPSVLPGFTLRERMGELSGSLALSAVCAGVTTTLWAALAQVPDWTGAGFLFFMTVAVCWAVLIPSKFWTARPGDEWMRRLVLAICGVVIGLGAMWLEGWSSIPASSVGDGWSSLSTHRDSITTGASYVSYFGLALGLLRWWKSVDRRRESWFSFFPVLATGIWSLLLLFIYPNPERPYGAASLVMASMIVQWVSPWQSPPPPLPRRLRLRRA
jgi:hypothetical protein